MPDFSGAIARHGKRVKVWRRVGGADDAFGVESESWVNPHSVLTTRSYPNRNTTVDESVGSMERDKSVFFFIPDADVISGDRIFYNGEYYELQSPTKYHTHTAMVANAVDDFAPDSK